VNRFPAESLSERQIDACQRSETEMVVGEILLGSPIDPKASASRRPPRGAAILMAMGRPCPSPNRPRPRSRTCRSSLINVACGDIVDVNARPLSARCDQRNRHRADLQLLHQPVSS